MKTEESTRQGLRSQVVKSILGGLAGGLLSGTVMAQAIVPSSIDRHSSKVLQVSYVLGSVTVRRNGLPVRLREGFLVFDDEQVAVGDGSRADMLLSRYGEMVLFPIEQGGAYLTFESLPFSDWQVRRDTLARLESGELRLLWNSPNSGDGWPLELAIGSWVARIGDGNYLFRNGSRGSQVCAIEGEMTLQNSRGQRFALHEGECMNNAVGYGPERVVIESGHWDRLGVVRGIPLNNPLAAPAAGGLKVESRFRAPRVIEDAHSGGPLPVPSPLVQPADGAPVPLSQPLRDPNPPQQIDSAAEEPSDFKTFQVSPAPLPASPVAASRLEESLEVGVAVSNPAESDEPVRDVVLHQEAGLSVASAELKNDEVGDASAIPELTADEQAIAEASLTIATPPASASPDIESVEVVEEAVVNSLPEPELVVEPEVIVVSDDPAPSPVQVAEKTSAELKPAPVIVVEKADATPAVAVEASSANNTIAFEDLFNEPSTLAEQAEQELPRPAVESAQSQPSQSVAINEAIEAERAIEANVAVVSSDAAESAEIGESLKIFDSPEASAPQSSGATSTALPPIIAKAFAVPPPAADAPPGDSVSSVSEARAESVQRPAMLGGGDGAWIVNVVSSSEAEDAELHIAKLRNAGFDASLREDTVRGRSEYRVVVAGIANEDSAVEIAQTLKKEHGYRTAWPLLKR